MKVTNKQIDLFRANARRYLGTPADPKNPADKLHHALLRMIKRTDNAFEEYTEKQEDINREYAELDEKGIYMIKDNQYQYKPEKDKKRWSELRELGRKQVEIEPYIATVLPKNLSPALFEVFIPFVIKEDILDDDEVEPVKELEHNPVE